MSKEEMVKIELVGKGWGWYPEFSGVSAIQMQTNDVDRNLNLFFDGIWRYFSLLEGHPYEVKISPINEERRTMLASLPPEPKPRPEWINFKTYSGRDVVISVRSIRFMVMQDDCAYLADFDNSLDLDYSDNLEMKCFKITHETYEQIKKQLMGEV